MVKTIKNLLLQNQKVDDLGTWYVALGMYIYIYLIVLWCPFCWTSIIIVDSDQMLLAWYLIRSLLFVTKCTQHGRNLNEHNIYIVYWCPRCCWRGTTPASNLGYLASPQDNFSWVPNCSLGPPGWETKVSSKKNLVWAM